MVDFFLYIYHATQQSRQIVFIKKKFWSSDTLLNVLYQLERRSVQLPGITVIRSMPT